MYIISLLTCHLLLAASSWQTESPTSTSPTTTADKDVITSPPSSASNITASPVSADCLDCFALLFCSVLFFHGRDKRSQIKSNFNIVSSGPRCRLYCSDWKSNFNQHLCDSSSVKCIQTYNRPSEFWSSLVERDCWSKFLTPVFLLLHRSSFW